MLQSSFIFGAVSAFRITRDGWVACVIALAFTAEALFSCDAKRQEFHLGELPIAAVVAGTFLMLTVPVSGFGSRSLDVAISSHCPVDAANFVRRADFQGPLYNSFGWGGFLTWYMPQFPVAIDGRTDLYVMNF